MKFFSLQQLRFPGGRALVVVVLLSYLALTGEAIHCQYFDHDHAAHHHSSEQTKGHQSHCMMAGHCAATALQTATITVIDPVQVAALLFHSTPALAGFSVSLSSSPRAPPSVTLTV
ncbi:MAG TPA: hypothetical protein VML36_00980 [Nitrospiria bacterium]|nr:hypothetical protein [Nitrospiria bacterium]